MDAEILSLREDPTPGSIPGPSNAAEGPAITVLRDSCTGLPFSWDLLALAAWIYVFNSGWVYHHLLKGEKRLDFDTS